MTPRAVYAHKGEYLGQLESTDAERSVLRLASGVRVSVPTEVLAARGDGSFELQAPLLEVGTAERATHVSERAIRFAGRERTPKSSEPERSPTTAEPARVPLVEEQLLVSKVSRPRGAVSVHVIPQVENRLLEIPLTEQHTEVKRVEVRKFVVQPPPVREEGDTVIIPLLEEVLVVEKRLLLREEIHLIRRARTRVEQREVALRSERADVERTPPPQG